ncbi:MAG: hypothetical protein AAFY22_06785 [Pseudomonadota bacterium]
MADSKTMISDLGIGTGYALWGFRASAARHANCPTLIRGFDQALSRYGRLALMELEAFARILGSKGRRRLSIGCPGCASVTADELSIAALLSAAQIRNEDLADAHAAWLMAGCGEQEAKEAAHRVGWLFCAGCLEIKAPPIEISERAERMQSLSLHQPGHA